VTSAVTIRHCRHLIGRSPPTRESLQPLVHRPLESLIPIAVHARPKRPAASAKQPGCLLLGEPPLSAIPHMLAQNASSEPPVTVLSVSSATSSASDKPDRLRATSPDNILAPYTPYRALDKNALLGENIFVFRILSLRFSSPSIGGPEAPQAFTDTNHIQEVAGMHREGPGGCRTACPGAASSDVLSGSCRHRHWMGSVQLCCGDATFSRPPYSGP